MSNFEAIVREFLRQNGAIQVKNAEALEQAVSFLLENPHEASELGRHAVAVVRQNLGAVERTVEMLVEQLEGTDVYVAPWRDEGNRPF